MAKKRYNWTANQLTYQRDETRTIVNQKTRDDYCCAWIDDENTIMSDIEYVILPFLTFAKNRISLCFYCKKILLLLSVNFWEDYRLGYRKISKWLNKSEIKTIEVRKGFNSFRYLSFKEKTRTWPKESTDKKSTFPH